ncbi:hypothetical protein S40293_07055 [Stachybotrys chartarum IBT 40293]|nr:hypothetical protein S40293_07055 [Stachybotrys chartarum IBT 40293]
MPRVQFEDKPWAKPNPGRVYVTRLGWVHYGHPDIETNHQFFLDFGFVQTHRTTNPERIFYRGYNDQPVLYVSEKTETPQFFGGSFEAASEEDLERASKIPGAGEIRDLDFPGGGKIVTILDPDNVPVNIIYGFQTVERGNDPRGAGPINLPLGSDDAKPRKGTFQRIPPGPAPVHKLGHFGHKTGDIAKLSQWYMTNFNLRGIDIQANPFNKSEVSAQCLPIIDVGLLLSNRSDLPRSCQDMAVFYNIDLGERYSDHHAFFHFSFFPGQKFPGPHHASFEVHDHDIQQQGHYHLLRKGHKQMWGLGRHLLGSQIFDYWYDPDGFTIEHYADGDVVNQDNEPERHVADRMEDFTIWGGRMNLQGAFEGDARPVSAAVGA